MTDFQKYLVKSLTEQEMACAMQLIMQGEVSDKMLASFLKNLSERGETAAEIAGAAKVMRNLAQTIKAPVDAVDCCGTGGDGLSTYNISTAVALVTAACGVPVAKHGNRSASSKSGAADVLEALGVHLDLSKPQLEQALHKFNFCFLMAPSHHKAMKHVMPVRKKLGFRTIFNLLGPLANPANTSYQLIGVYDKKWLLPMAEALKALGTKRAWLVHGHDGLDEITITAPTDIIVLNNEEITSHILTPQDFGLSVQKAEDLTGGDSQINANALLEILKGRHNAYRDIVVANSAAVLAIHHNAPIKDLPALARKASTIIDSGEAYKVLQSYIEYSRGFKK